MRKLEQHHVAFVSPAGELVAYVRVIPARADGVGEAAPLVEVDEDEAREHGETVVQLRESERYEYEVIPENGADLRLRCRRPESMRRRSLIHGAPDAGMLETRSFCGTMLLELVEGEVDDAKPAVATALLDVRSVKLDYRTEYRGMLRSLAEEIAGLVADARSSVKAGFSSSFEERDDAGWLQIQLELLRETLDGTDFAAALQRILSFPHERLSAVSDAVASDRPIRWMPVVVRQLVTGNPRRQVPAGHPLRERHGLESVAGRVVVPRKSRDLDTPENRFVKFVLAEFRAFLTHAQAVFESSAEWSASVALCRRLAAVVEDWLGRALFRDLGQMRFAPLGSPVLQRKAGYREVLRCWLRFRTAAELSWQGGEDVFHAGQRDVAGLYEYWLFFRLLEWFCGHCRGGVRPDAPDLLDGLEEGQPTLRLRKRVQLGPITGMFAGQSRPLNALFAYNRRFEVTSERHEGGSWTRRLHPDYTLTFWPADFTQEQAERLELLAHVHFDAKYRVEDIEGLFGPDGTDDADEESDGNYKRQDLLKMHAYRDAIRRSQGAYVLYPGRGKGMVFQGFHEILPGLGAFAVAPDEEGVAQGFDAVEDFLAKVLAHLGNRTTARERAVYHLAQSYRSAEEPVLCAQQKLPERDSFETDQPALPPAEHMVLVAWYRDARELAWTAEQGIVAVRLGALPGTWHVQPDFANVRHLLLHSRVGVSAPGLWRLRSPGFKVFTAQELMNIGCPGLAGGEIYALFEVERDPDWVTVAWDRKELIRAIRAFESRVQHRLAGTIHRLTASPRIVPLRDLLYAQSTR